MYGSTPPYWRVVCLPYKFVCLLLGQQAHLILSILKRLVFSPFTFSFIASEIKICFRYYAIVNKFLKTRPPPGPAPGLAVRNSAPPPSLTLKSCGGMRRALTKHPRWRTKVSEYLL